MTFEVLLFVVLGSIAASILITNHRLACINDKLAQVIMAIYETDASDDPFIQEKLKTICVQTAGIEQQIKKARQLQDHVQPPDQDPEP